MKYIGSLLLCLLAITCLSGQEKKAYVSIDVSLSMRGNKYNLANYTVQMITALMDEKDELYLSICGDFKKVNTSRNNRQTAINALQLPFSKHREVNTEIGDIKAFIKQFTYTPGRQHWYFIVGDGYWKVKDTCEEFKELVTEQPIHVVFLETMKDLSEHGEFGQCLDDLNFVTQYRSSDQAQTIMDNCILLATSLFDVSEKSLATQEISDQVYRFTSEIPLKKIYIVYQDEKNTNRLPILQSASYKNTNLPIVRQSLISTEKMISNSKGILLSGQVIVLDQRSVISANEPIDLNFDKDIDPSKLKIYPVADAFLVNTRVETTIGIPQIKGDETTVCLENKKAKIIYEILDSQGNKLPTSILEQTKATVKTEGGELKARLNNDAFECEIPLSEIETLYQVNVVCDGYYNLVSEKKKIIRSANCVMPVEGEMKRSGDIHIKDLFTNNACISVRIINKNNPSEILNPLEHEISAHVKDRYLFEEAIIRNVTDQKFDICLRARNSLCECFIPDSVTITINSIDKTGRFEPLEEEMTISIDKSNTTWMQRCSWLFIAIIALFILIIYLRALNKKKRFKKGSMVRYQYFGVGNIKSRENVDDLREKGFFAWINRWLVPSSAERTTKSFPKAGNKVFSFSATNSSQRIEIPKTQYNPKEMSSIDFDRNQFERKDNKTFTMSDNTYIKITLPGGTGSFQICYDRGAGVKDDVPAFKAFTSFIMVIAGVAILALGYLIVRSFM